MNSQLILALTNCGILKWKKRINISYFQIDDEKYACSFRNYKIRISVQTLYYPELIKICIFKNDIKVYEYCYDKYTWKLYNLLNNMNINNYYISEKSLNNVMENMKRTVKINLLLQKIEVF